jgi:hypothetical protein
MPTDIDKALKFVLVLLPGFVCIGLVALFSDLELSEFYFTYLSIALTVLFYWTAIGTLTTFYHAVSCWTKHGDRVEKKYSLKLVAPLLFIYSLLTATLITNIYEQDKLFSFAKSTKLVNFSKMHQKRPLRVICNDITSANEDQILNSDARGAIKDPKNGKFKSRGKPYVRVFVDKIGYYEGSVRWYPSRNDPDELYLSPACVNYEFPSKGISPNNLTLIKGPGVYIAGAKITSVELLDPTDCACHCLAFPDLCPETP